ncbi:MAG: hypothetical protein K9L02_04780 [Acholeplasmataceae bacterium]|nr:hypothetical protein [Acholeplasmataceae bacterium]
MQFIRDNFAEITVILFIIVTILLLMILSFNRYFVKYFSNKKFQINTSYQVDAASQEKQFVISIFNKNINDVRISGFGYVYQNQNIDFYKNYLVAEDLPKDHKIVIPSRDFIFAKIDVLTLKTIISDINRGDTSVRSLKVFVTDSQGLTAQSRAKAVRKQLHYHLEKDRIERLIKIKEQKRRVKADEALFKQQKRIERNVHRKEIWGKMFLKVKGVFRNKSK